MHFSSLENMRTCRERYANSAGAGAPAIVVELGSRSVNGSFRALFPEPQFRYCGLDLEPGDGVDVVLEDPYRLPLPDGHADFVICGQVLEHTEQFWRAFAEMARVLKPDGWLFLIVPSTGPIHRFPVDCYRFHPDALQGLAKFAGIHVVAQWRDSRPPWRDLVGVFRKQPTRLPDAAPQSPSWAFDPDPSADREAVSGQLDYREQLKRVHELLAPRNYLEIGVFRGDSLALARCPAIGVDPDYDVQQPLHEDVRLFRKESDRFFDEDAGALPAEGVDLSFIDGLHWFEQVLRDFVNVERRAHPASLVIVDDIFPNRQQQARRVRATGNWTGDVWKLVVCLSRFRPELLLLPLDTRPTGMLLVAGLDPDAGFLDDAYDAVVRELERPRYERVPPRVLQRRGAIAPDDLRVTELLRLLRAGRERGVDPDWRKQLGELRGRLRRS